MSQELERVYTINLGKALLSVDTHRAPRAINMIKEFASHHMKTSEIKIDEDLAHIIWARGVRSPPRKIRVRMNKTDEGYVLVSPYTEGTPSKEASSKKEKKGLFKKKKKNESKAEEKDSGKVEEKIVAEETKQEAPKEVKKEIPTEVKKEATKEVKKEATKEVKKEAAKEVKKEAPKEKKNEVKKKSK